MKADISITAVSVMAALAMNCAVFAGSAPSRPEADALAPSNRMAFAEGCALPVVADADAQAMARETLRRADASTELPAIVVVYPFADTMFPPDFAAPTFLWRETAVAATATATADIWLVVVELDHGAIRLGILVTGALACDEIDSRLLVDGKPVRAPAPCQLPSRGWKPDASVWALIKQKSAGSPARITFIGLRKPDIGKPVSKGGVTLTTSLDPVGAPIFYRDVPLMPSATATGVIKPLPTAMLPLVEWRLRDVSKPASRLMLTNLYTCANCHSFAADGRTLGMDLDGPTGDKGAYALTTVATDTTIRASDIITWNAFKGRLPDHNTIGFLSRVSPDGRYVVSTVNEEVYVANFTDYRFLQVFYPTRGTLAWYARATDDFKALPGADDLRFVHCDAVWSPDGKWLVFARAKARDAYPKGRKLAVCANDANELPMQYDLCRLSFNNGRGGTPELIAGAANDGVSHSFPAISPDGKWIVFVVCRNGQLMRPDSTLWIVPFAGGVARKMRCNTSLMNSWHSFSPNSRWLVFSSKTNTPYTQMFLTHVDADGNDTPPVLVENATAANRAVNIPEFVNAPYEGFQRLAAPSLAYYADFHRGSDLAEQGRIKEAIEAYSLALQSSPDESCIHNDLGVAFGRLGALEEAATHFRRVIAINPAKPQAYSNLALVMVRMGKLEEAAELYDKAIGLDASIPEVWYGRGMVRRQQGHATGAAQDFRKCLEVAPPQWAAREKVLALLDAKQGLP